MLVKALNGGKLSIEVISDVARGIQTVTQTSMRSYLLLELQSTEENSVVL